MNSSMSFIHTVIERVRAMMDEPDQSGKYTDDFLVRHYVMPSLADVWSRLNNSSTSRVVVRLDVTLNSEVKRYRLPACCAQVVRVVAVDSEGRAAVDWRPRSLYHRDGPGWRLEGFGESLELVWDTVPAGFTEAQVWYVPTGDVMCHYSSAGGSATQVAVTGASWDEASMTLTKVGGFASYTFEEGDMISLTTVSGGSTIVAGVVSRTSDDAVVLDASPGDGSSGIAARLWCRSLVLATTPTIGSVDRRENGYLGQVVRVLLASPQPVYARQVIGQSVTPAGVWTLTLSGPVDVGAAPSAVPYEVAPAGCQGMWEAVAMRVAVKLSVVRRWSETARRALQVEYLSAMKTIGDTVANMQGRTGKCFELDTVDNPNQRGSGVMAGVVDTTI